ncbi:MAG: PepSY domain-containing protein [Nitrospirota bacterium]
MGRRRTIGLLLAALAAAWMIVPSAAVADDDHEEATELQEAGVILPLADILARAQAIRPGRVIETELEREDGRYLYELEILDDTGVVWEMTLDAATGEPLAGHEERKP